MAERMTSESWRVVRFRWYTVLWPEESAKAINQSVSGGQVNRATAETLKNKHFVGDSHKKLIRTKMIRHICGLHGAAVQKMNYYAVCLIRLYLPLELPCIKTVF